MITVYHYPVVLEPTLPRKDALKLGYFARVHFPSYQAVAQIAVSNDPLQAARLTQNRRGAPWSKGADVTFLGSKSPDRNRRAWCRSTNVGDVLDIDTVRVICMPYERFMPFYGPDLRDGLPRLVGAAIGRLARGEELLSATTAIWEAATIDERSAVDKWLTETRHSLIHMVRADAQRRFRALVDMEADTAAASYG